MAKIGKGEYYYPSDKWFKAAGGWVRVQKFLTFHNWEKWTITTYLNSAIHIRYGKQWADDWNTWKETYEADMAHRYFQEAMNAMNAMETIGNR